MPIRQSDKYELPEGETEQSVFADKLGVKIDSFVHLGMSRCNEFHSQQVTISGKQVIPRHSPKYFKKNKISEAIKGLNCPDCQAQAYRTDQKQVAVCGDYPGWYFFYRRLQEEKEPERTTKYIIKNGEIVEAEEETMETAKQI